MIIRKARPDRNGRWLGTGKPRHEELEYVVWALNGKTIFRECEGEEFGDSEEILRETPPILREIVQRWQASGPDLYKFHRGNPTTWAALGQHLKENVPSLWYTVGSGGANLICNPYPSKTPYQEAVRLFLLLILNPEWGKLAGPCVRCGNYYIRGNARNKSYCSRSCGTRATALAATKQKREEARAEKLRRVTELCKQWRTKRTSQDWKSWVCGHDITKTFLTRAVNKGDLRPPVRN